MSLWTTRSDELVGIGDMVALFISQETETVGRITAETGDGQVQCLVVRGSNNLAGNFINVDADQLLLRVWS